MTNPRDKRLLISKVNASPKGLQSLLGNVNQGVNPHELDHVVSPGVDLYPHWAADKTLVKSETTSVVPSPGNGMTITVPEGEIWQPIAIGGVVSMLIAVEYAFSVGILNPASLTHTTVASAVTDQAAVATNNQLRAGYVFPNRFFLSGGWGIRFQYNWSTSVAARSITLNVLYVKITE